MSLKLHKNDEVIITSGKDKGKKGKIEKVIRKNNTILLPGLNLFKRHLKKRDEKNPGGIIDVSRPVKIANVAYICPKCSKPARIGYVFEGNVKKRVCRKCDSII